MDFEALEQRVNEVLMQHYRRISDFSDKKCTTTANDIITEIRTALCNTHQMLIDWRESQTSTRIKEKIEIKTEPGNVKYFFSNFGSGGKEPKSMNTSPSNKRRKITFPPKNSITLPFNYLFF